MSWPSVLLQELRHRWVSASLLACTVALAVASVMVFVFLGRAAQQETRVVQRDIGLNVVILSEETDLGAYYARGFSDHDIPAEYVERLSDQEVANRLVPLLRQRVTAGVAPNSIEVMLTGIGQEIFKGGKPMKAVFGMELAADEVVIGGAVAERMSLARGDTLKLLGEDLRVTRTLTSAGTEEDVTVYGNLGTVQRLLDREGLLNEIQAIECHCGEDVQDPLAHLRGQLEELLPGTRVLRRNDLADARRSQRLAAERLVVIATPTAVALAALLVAALAWLNTRERRAELGLLRTLGVSGLGLSSFVLGRTWLLALLGTALGCGLGQFLSAELVERIYTASTPGLGETGTFWLEALALAPLFAALSALVPVVSACRSDPAEVLLGD